MKLKVNDKVVVIAGASKGKEGKITKTFRKENKVIVEGVNIVKKHVKGNGQNETGGILETEAPIHISNVAVASKKETKKETKKEVKETKKAKTSKKKDKESK